MPSQLHEVLLQLFRNRPSLAPELLRDALHQELPSYTEVRIDSADLSEIQPTEYRADLVVLLLDGVPVFGIVVEVQLSPDERKQYVWPAYVAGLRARFECPVCLLVITADDACARWAARPIPLGGSSCLVPWVVGPSGVPEIADEDVARADPELAVLSAMAHGKDADIERSIRIALAAQRASANLDEDRARLYCDLILHSLSEAARRAFQIMDMSKYEYQSDFARRYVAQGKAEIVLRQLTLRFGQLDDAAKARIAGASRAELDAVAERLLTAQTLQEALG